MTVDHGSAMPPYRQLAGILRDQIASGELAPGAAFRPGVAAPAGAATLDQIVAALGRSPAWRA